MGILRWLTETRKNKALTGDESPSLFDIGEMLLPFVVPLDTLKVMDDEQVKSKVDDLLDNMEGDEFTDLQAHAQSEFAKFYNSATTPKKPQNQPRNASIWARIKMAWLVVFRA